MNESHTPLESADCSPEARIWLRWLVGMLPDLAAQASPQLRVDRSGPLGLAHRSLLRSALQYLAPSMPDELLDSIQTLGEGMEWGRLLRHSEQAGAPGTCFCRRPAKDKHRNGSTACTRTKRRAGGLCGISRSADFL